MRGLKGNVMDQVNAACQQETFKILRILKIHPSKNVSSCNILRSILDEPSLNFFVELFFLAYKKLISIRVLTYVIFLAISGNPAHKVKASHKLKAQTSKIVSSFKNPTMTCNMVKEYRGHRDGIWEVSMGRSGQPIIATASADHTAKIWGMDSCRCLLQYTGHSGSVNSVRFHPTKDLALSASGDGSAHVWQAAVNWDVPKRPSLEDVANAGDRGASASGSDNAPLEEEATPTLRTPVKELLGHTGVVIAADWLFGAEQIVTASWDRTANLYDAETGEVIHTLCGHDQELTYVATHHAQRLCVTSSRDSTFRLWDFREPIHSVSVFQGHTE